MQDKVKDEEEITSKAATGRRLREARALKGYTQKDVEDETGVSAKLISQMENARAALTKENAVILGKCYKVEASYLLGFTVESGFSEKIYYIAMLLQNFFSKEEIADLTDYLEYVIKKRNNSLK